MKRVCVLVLASLVTAACGEPPLTPVPTPAPLTLTPASGPGSAVAFNDLSSHGAPVASYTEAGYTVTASAGAWTASTSYGNPKPFIQFATRAGETTEGRVDITAGGAVFTFTSVDLYASIIPIPYQITGLRNGAVVFTLNDRLPNTFGRFMTVTNAQTTAAIDTLRIVLINAGPPCCANPMGIDTLVFGQ